MKQISLKSECSGYVLISGRNSVLIQVVWKPLVLRLVPNLLSDRRAFVKLNGISFSSLNHHFLNFHVLCSVTMES